MAEFGCLASTPLEPKNVVRIPYAKIFHYLTGLAIAYLRSFQQCLHLFEHDSLGHAGASERVSLPSSSEVRLLVALVVPALLLAMLLQLAGRADSLRLSHGC